ncbi:MAG: MFS transporter [Solirubrobacterales bacterium]|nr:MFS transporter [Solirubrobacterales bacterium]
MARPRPAASPLVLTAGVMVIAVNLRPAAASLGPVLHRIQSATGLSSSAVGLLPTLTVLCFGLLAPLAPVLARRVGMHATIAASMWLLLAGLALRLVPGIGLLFAGTVLAGTAIAVGNVLVPVLVRRDLPERTGTTMALYTFALIGFASLASGVTVPVADALGGGWRPGLAVWAIPAAIAAVAWLPALGRRAAPAGTGGDPAPAGTGGDPAPAGPVRDVPAPPPMRELVRHPLAWQVTLFFALQSGGYYSTLAWLPSIFASHGVSDAHAGLLLSLTTGVGLVVALVVPGLAGRFRDQRALIVGCCALTGAGILGVWLAPLAAPYLWTVLLGLGQNAALPLALMLIVLRGGDVATTESLSTMAQSIGYVLAAAAPLAAGALHGLAGSWDPPLVLMLALVAPELLIGLRAARDRRLDLSAGQPGEDGHARGQPALS